MFEAKVNIEVSMACERTIDAIERNGGTVLTRWVPKTFIATRVGLEPATHRSLILDVDSLFHPHIHVFGNLSRLKTF